MAQTLYKQMCPPGGVTHALVGNVTGQQNLIVVKSTVIELYIVRQADGVLSGSGKLFLVCEQQLFGVVQDAQILYSRAPLKQKDAIMLAFRDAKVSVLEWECDENTLKPSSLHFLDQLEDRKSGRSDYVWGPRLSTDPLGRCAALLFFNHQLAIFRSVGADPSDLDAIDYAGTPKKVGVEQGAVRVSNCYTLNLAKLQQGKPIRSVRDMVFLHGFNEPVLLLLSEETPTWSGNFRDVKDTCRLEAISGTSSQRPALIWQCEHLPSDASSLLACPMGGALLMCRGIIMHFDNQGRHCALVVNESVQPGVVPDQLRMQHHITPEVMMQMVVDYSLKYANNIHPDVCPQAIKNAAISAHLQLNLLGCEGVWISGDLAVASTYSGRIILIGLKRDVESTHVKRIEVFPLQKYQMTQLSAVCKLGQNLLFLASKFGPSLLVHYRTPQDGSPNTKQPVEKMKQESRQEDLMGDTIMEDAPSAKKQKVETDETFDALLGLEADNNQTNTGQGDAFKFDWEDELEEQAKKQGSSSQKSDVNLDELSMADRIARHKRYEMEVQNEMESLYEDDADVENPSALMGFDAAPKISLTQVDSLKGFTAVHDITQGDFQVFHNLEGDRQQKRDVPVVGMCQGYGKKGEFTVACPSWIPEVFGPLPLAGIVGVWAVKCLVAPISAGSSITAANAGRHSYLFISDLNSTKVLQEEEDWIEMDPTKFKNETVRTICAGSMLHGQVIVQVVQQGVRLTYYSPDPSNLVSVFIQIDQLFNVVINPNKQINIVFGAMTEQYLLLRTSDNRAVILVVTKTVQPNGDVLIDLEQIPEAESVLTVTQVLDSIVSCNLYEDSSGWLTNITKQNQQYMDESEEKIFLLVCRRFGMLQIFSLPGMQQVYSLSGVAAGFTIIGSDVVDQQHQEHAHHIFAVEVRLDCFVVQQSVRQSLKQKNPKSSVVDTMPVPQLLLITSEGIVLSYSAFLSKENKIRFRRNELNQNYVPDEEIIKLGQQQRGEMLIRFDHIGSGVGYSGIILCGGNPQLFLADRGRYLQYPVCLSDPLNTVAQFFGVEAGRVFIFAMTSLMQVCQIFPQHDLGCSWPSFRIPLRGTPRGACWVPNIQHFAVVHEEFHKYEARSPLEYDANHVDIHALSAYIASDEYAKHKDLEVRCRITLLDPHHPSLQPHLLEQETPQSGFLFDPMEKVLCVRNVRLTNHLNQVIHNLVAVGTAITYGEDIPCHGMVYLFETGLSARKATLTLVLSRELNGPITEIQVMQTSKDAPSNLVLAKGNRVEVNEWFYESVNKWELKKAAFYDLPVFVTSMRVIRLKNVIKPYIIASDMQGSAYFLQYKETQRQIELLGRDLYPMSAVVNDFVLKGNTLTFLATDMLGNLRTMNFETSTKIGLRKEGRLAPSAMFHTGATINKALNVVMPNYPHEAGKQMAKQGVLLGSTLGNFALMAPLWFGTPLPTRLNKLEKMLVTALVQNAGLNPIAFRHRYQRVLQTIQPPHRQTILPTPPLPYMQSAPREDLKQYYLNMKTLSTDGIIDGDLVTKYVSLPLPKQLSIAEQMNVKRVQLLKDLKDFEMYVCILQNN